MSTVRPREPCLIGQVRKLPGAVFFQDIRCTDANPRFGAGTTGIRFAFAAKHGVKAEGYGLVMLGVEESMAVNCVRVEDSMVVNCVGPCYRDVIEPYRSR